MVEELKKYIDELFETAPKTRAAYELKEELMANSTERYFDLVEEKVPEKEALDIVINSIGDFNQLFENEEVKAVSQSEREAVVKKTALYKAIAIGLYIFGFGVAVLFEEYTPYGSLGFVAMILIAALATCILVYVSAAYPKYKRTDDTVVEEFKEWSSSQKKRKSIRQSVSTIVWMVVLILYFIISFATMAWHITWLMFLIGVCAQSIVNLLFQLNDKQ
ncbi:MAG: permease prefix domain 1-containing protein [Lachnospiraceae bacterium]